MHLKNVFLLTGSNLGDSTELLRQVALNISEEAGNLIRKSSVYFSESWGYESKNSYFNQCLEIETELIPMVLMEKLLEIEHMMGRERKSIGYSDRIIDIDILFYGDEIINAENLIIPHPRLHLRKFALIPLNEIAAEFIHPCFKKKVSRLLEECTDNSVVKKIL